MADESLYGPASIADTDSYHNDVVASLIVYFSSTGLPHFQTRFAGFQPHEVNEELSKRLNETDIRSSLTILAYLEAAFRTDYEERSKKRKRDALSKEFRQLWKVKQQRAGLDEEIFEAWKTVHTDKQRLISELRSAFRFRHWLAHGRYWVPKLGRKYDYVTILGLAEEVMDDFFPQPTT